MSEKRKMAVRIAALGTTLAMGSSALACGTLNDTGESEVEETETQAVETEADEDKNDEEVAENDIFYIKNGQLWDADVSTGESVSLNCNLSDGENELAYSENQIGQSIAVSADGNVIFYPSMSGDETVLCRKVRGEEGQKLAPMAEKYQINTDGTLITFGNYYLGQYNIENGTATLVENGTVPYFDVFDGGEKVLYLSFDESAIYQYYDGKKELVVDEVTQFQPLGNHRYIYEKNGGWHEIRIKNKTVELDEKFYPHYGIEQNPENITWMDLVYDDADDTDAVLTCPEEPTEPEWWEYDTSEEYDLAYEEYVEALHIYYEIDNEYYEKQMRDEIRAELSETCECLSSVIYYYDEAGNKTLVALNYLTDGSEKGVNTDVLLYSTVDISDVRKLIGWPELAVQEDAAGRKAVIFEACESVKKTYIAVKGETPVLLSEQKAGEMGISKDKTTGYFFEDVDRSDDTDDLTGKLYKIMISDGQVETTLCADRAMENHVISCENGKVLYSTEESHSAFSGMRTYLDQQEIGELVQGRVTYSPDGSGTLYFCDNWDVWKQSGTLFSYEDGQKQKLAENVYDYVVSKNGWVAFLCNYEEERETGDLYILKDGVTEKIEEGVSALIPRSDYEHKGVQWELDSFGNIFHTSLGNTQTENTNN